MTTIAVLAPMSTELAPIRKKLKLTGDPRDADQPATWSGRCGDLDIVAAMAGVGTAHSGRITEELIALTSPDHVVVVGVAGGLAPSLKVADLIVPAVVHNIDTGTTHHASPLGSRTPEGEIVTSTRFHGWDVLSAHADAGMLAVDMETAAVAAAAERAGLPWTAIRTLSDVVREGTIPSDSLDLLREDGTSNIGGVVRYLARHPRRVPTLVRMGRDATRATSAAARTLREELRTHR